MVMYIMISFQSPYGDFGTLTMFQNKKADVVWLFQSPYGDFGTLTWDTE